MAMPSSTITRYELGATIEEFDLAMNRKKFIGPKVLRPRLVGIQAADVGKIPLAQLLQDHETIRAPGAGYSRASFKHDKWPYATDEYGHEEPMDDRTLNVFRDLIDAEAIHAQRAMDFVLRGFERDVAAAVYNTTTWTGAALTTAITHEWDDHVNAVPMTDVFNAKEKVLVGSGLEANALIMNSFQFWHLAQCAQIVDRVKYSGHINPIELVKEALQKALQIDNILVAGGLRNTANEAQAASISRIWGNEYMMVAAVATGDDPREPSLGRTFIYTGDGPGGPGSDSELAVVVEEYREEAVRGGVIRARNDRQVNIMYPAAAHLLSNAITI